MGYRIKERREDMKMTQTELSEKSGVSRPTIIELEKGIPVEVKLGTLKKLADALQCKPADLIF